MSHETKELAADTVAIHAGHEAPGCVAPVAVPIYQTVSFHLESAEQAARLFAHEEDGYVYTRYGNPTIAAFEEKIAALEGGDAAHAAASGMAAISTATMTALSSGDHVVCCDCVYSGTFELFSSILPKWGVQTTFVDGADVDAFRDAMRPNTKLCYLESPGNPTLKVIDIRAVAAMAKAAGCLVMVDNTFATPINQKPLALGADVVLHSATKYIGGHGDMIGGVIVGSKDFVQQAWHTHIILGGAVSPLNAYLALRGVQTLPLRVRQHNHNALEVARALEGHLAVASVSYPGLPSHPQRAVAARQMTGFGGMVCFELRGGLEAGRALMNAVRLCTLAVSLGDTKTLICHPASTTHASVGPEERLRRGITDGLVRLSVGLEDPGDIVADLDQALRKADQR